MDYEVISRIAEQPKRHRLSTKSARPSGSDNNRMEATIATHSASAHPGSQIQPDASEDIRPMPGTRGVAPASRLPPKRERACIRFKKVRFVYRRENTL